MGARHFRGLGCILPELLEISRRNAVPQGDDGVGAFDGPEHAGFFQALSHLRLASGINDARTDKKAQGSELGIAHSGGVFFKVGNFLFRFLTS